MKEFLKKIAAFTTHLLTALLSKSGNWELVHVWPKWISRAYRNILAAPTDHRLLRLKWQSQVYVDKVLPFRLHSVPLIFSAVADSLL